MTFPSVAGTALTVSPTTDSTSFVANLPAGIVAGELLLLLVSADGNPTLTAPAGWNKIGQQQNGSTVMGAPFWKIANGSEGATVTLTSSVAEQYTSIAYRIQDAKDVTGSSAGLSSSNSNPPSHTRPVAQDYLWVVSRHGNSTGVATAAPTNYTNLLTRQAGGTSSVSTNSAIRPLNAATEDPGTFVSSATQWACWTLAVGPSAVTGAASVAATLATASGTGAVGDLAISGAGVAQAQSAIASGSGSSVQPGSAAQTAQQATNAGLGKQANRADGAAQSQRATASVSGQIANEGIGSAQPVSAIASGSGSSIQSGSAALSAQQAINVGLGKQANRANGAVQSQRATADAVGMAGEQEANQAQPATVAAQQATAAATGNQIQLASGNAQAPRAIGVSVGLGIHQGTIASIARSATMLGLGLGVLQGQGVAIAQRAVVVAGEKAKAKVIATEPFVLYFAKELLCASFSSQPFCVAFDPDPFEVAP